MYLDYFGLHEAPFSITPDPSFIYLSGRHRDALAHLLYGVGQGGSGGFVQLTGEVGTGKTTLCRALLEQVPPGTHIALVLNPLMGPVEMLAANVKQPSPFRAQHPLVTVGRQEVDSRSLDVQRKHAQTLDGIEKQQSTPIVGQPS